MRCSIVAWIPKYWNFWDISKLDREKKTSKVEVVVQSLGHVQLFATPWTAAHQASLSFTISRSLLKLMCIELVMPSKLIELSSCSIHGRLHWMMLEWQTWSLLLPRLKNQQETLSRTIIQGKLMEGLSKGVSMLARSLSCVWLFVTPRPVAHQTPLSMGFLR